MTIKHVSVTTSRGDVKYFPDILRFEESLRIDDKMIADARVGVALVPSGNREADLSQLSPFLSEAHLIGLDSATVQSALKSLPNVRRLSFSYCELPKYTPSANLLRVFFTGCTGIKEFLGNRQIATCTIRTPFLEPIGFADGFRAFCLWVLGDSFRSSELEPERFELQSSVNRISIESIFMRNLAISDRELKAVLESHARSLDLVDVSLIVESKTVDAKQCQLNSFSFNFAEGWGQQFYSVCHSMSQLTSLSISYAFTGEFILTGLDMIPSLRHLTFNDCLFEIPNGYVNRNITYISLTNCTVSKAAIRRAFPNAEVSKG